MSYRQGEEALLNLARGLADWDEHNSISSANDSQNKGRLLLASGKSKHYLILRPGPFERRWLDINQTASETDWQTIAQVYVQQHNATRASAEMVLADLRQGIIEQLDANPDFYSQVEFALVLSGGVPEARLADRASTSSLAPTNEAGFIVQEMVILWRELNE